MDRESNVLLRVRGIHKWFPGVHALDDVQLEVRRGEVHAIVGENGAGKSTLMQILAGVYLPDAGQFEFDGEETVIFSDERAAQKAGIALVYQERSLFGPLSIANNVFAGRQPCNAWGHIRARELYANTRALLTRVGLESHPSTPIDSLNPAHQQLVEIAKALSLNPRLIIFDEPTASLSLRETKRLFNLIRQLKQDGLAVLYISHHLQEIFELADRVTILKDGTYQGTFPTSSLSQEELVSKMVGRAATHIDDRMGITSDDQSDRSHPEATTNTREPLLRVLSLNDRQPLPHHTRLRNIQLEISYGEIVGVSGLVGAGRTELALALFGARSNFDGQIYFAEKSFRFSSPEAAIAAGIGYVPEDRKAAGLFLEMSILDNILAAVGDRFGGWWQRRSQQRAAVSKLCQQLRIRYRSMDDPVRVLSGGNQQKVVLAKWLLAEPRLLIIDEPTRGVDVGAKTEIHDLLRKLAKQGTTILMISSDLPEILAVSDRIVVMRGGRIAGELHRAAASEDAIMRLAAMGERTSA